MRRHTEAKKTPVKSTNLKASKLPRKDVMRSEVARQKVGSVQTICNPMRSSSHYFTEKPVYSQILDNNMAVYKDRQIRFEKRELTGKISENKNGGFIVARKSTKQMDIPIKLNMMSANDLK